MAGDAVIIQLESTSDGRVFIWIADPMIIDRPTASGVAIWLLQATGVDITPELMSLIGYSAETIPADMQEPKRQLN